ncbi:MAG TPA: hypothetical protein VGN16_17325 [Acidobacteriaceae bacterium]
MSRRNLRVFFVLLLFAAFGGRSYAHVGSKDVFEELTAGPYKLFVTVRMPVVIPGVAQLEVRATGPGIDSIEVTPVPMVGESSKHPPTPDGLKRSSADPDFYTGSLWIMASGSWKVQFTVNGAAGTGTAAVPAPAAPLVMLPMQRGLGVMLAVLGVVLVLGMAGIVGAAVREARVPPGTSPDAGRKRWAAMASVAALVLGIVAAAGGGYWWSAEAADYAGAIFRPAGMEPVLTGDTLDLKLSPPEYREKRRRRAVSDLLLDHGKLMHLYAIREPEMDAAFHLHPSLVKPGELQMNLPAMPPGEYALYADIVHASGFPETLTAKLMIPPGMQGTPLAADDAFAAPAALSKGELGTTYKLPDGYSMVWDKPAKLSASTAYSFHFRLLDPSGKPATGMEPYLGMAGHAAFVKTDGTVFAHTHPEGSAAMPAMMIANGNVAEASTIAAMPGMPRMAGMAETQAVGPEVDFPYGFPAEGRYRIFIQMKHGGVVETGVFDAIVE